MKIRICIVSPGAACLFFPERRLSLGGSEIQQYLTAVEFASRNDFEVHFIVHGERREVPFFHKDIKVHSVKFVPGLLSKLEFQRKMLSIDADVYLQQGSGSITKEMAFFCLWARKKFVFWVGSDHDVNPDSRIARLDRNRWFIWGVKRAHLRIAQTRFQARCLMDFLQSESVIIPNGFPLRPPANRKREYVLWVGRFSPEKRPELFVKLARQIPEERFLMIGLVSDELTRRHYESVEGDIQKTANLQFIPGVPFFGVEEFFDRAKLLVNTSLVEGFPNTFIQAMLSGVPLASLSFDPDGIIRGDGLGIPPQEDINRFSEEITSLLNRPLDLERCKEAALKYATEHHNIVQGVDLLAENLRRILKPSRSNSDLRSPRSGNRSKIVDRF
jgi:glycosyltransferase involved in cell wall biosynthesis